jgi:hypothetical protein
MQMLFNIGFTPEDGCEDCGLPQTPAINHARAPFTENKRYRMKRPPMPTW